MRYDQKFFGSFFQKRTFFLGALKGNMAWTTGIVKRSMDRLSCIAWRGAPSRWVRITERA
jgi:hypothetical protein